MGTSEYEQLAAAIILRAVIDYANAVKIFNNTIDDYSRRLACKEMENIEKFVRSKWYTELSSISPSMMLDKLAKIKSGELVVQYRKKAEAEN